MTAANDLHPRFFSAAAYQTIISNGLKEVVDELFLSRSPVIANIAVSIHGAGIIRGKKYQQRFKKNERQKKKEREREKKTR